MTIKKALLGCLLTATAATAMAEDALSDETREFSNRDLRGTWTLSGWVEATLLVPFPAETTHATPPSSIVSPGDKVTIRGTEVGLFTFNGRGRITAFQDLFKVGGLAPLSPPFPLPFLPPLPEAGHGSYAVMPDGTAHLSTIIIDPATGATAGEAEYDCVLNRSPRRMECIFSRFRTYVVDPGGFDAPIVGQVTLRPQRR
jgi:hypothetical protein